METAGLDSKYMVYGMLFAVCNRIQTYGDEQLKDITMKQHFMMVVLDLYGEKTPTLSELADTVGCSYQNIKRMATSLEKNNYVSIVEDDKDKRKRHIVMTDKFHKMGERERKMTWEFMEGLYSGISEEELVHVAAVLNKMENNIKRMAGVQNKMESNIKHMAGVQNKMESNIKYMAGAQTKVESNIKHMVRENRVNKE